MAFGVVLGLPSSGSDDSNKPELILSSYSGSIAKDQTITFTVTTPSDGRLFVFSSDINIAEASITDNTVTITGINNGQAIITVAQEAGTNYNIPDNKTFLCIVKTVSPGVTLDTTEWDDIIIASRAGIGDSYWDIGDVKSITLNGKIGAGLTLSNFETNVFILHFNYSMNGVADNNIIWGGFKDSNGVDIALVDSNYSNFGNDNIMYFNMNHRSSSNYGGWKGSDFRYDILGATSTPPSNYGSGLTNTNVGYDATSATLTNPKANTLLAALPFDFKNSLRLWSRWIDAVGNKSNVEENIEETIDAVTLLAEFEVFGTRTEANQYEQNHQSQMEYYRLGNSTIKYQHNDSSSSVNWWLASPANFNFVLFCGVHSDGKDGVINAAQWIEALAPAFKT